MTELVTTLNKIRACSPCVSGWKKLLLSLGKTEADDDPLPFHIILESNGLDDALWCCRSAPEFNNEWRLFAVWCARRVQHLMTDDRSIRALDVAENHAHGNATDKDLVMAWSAARSAAWYAAGAAQKNRVSAHYQTRGEIMSITNDCVNQNNSRPFNISRMSKGDPVVTKGGKEFVLADINYDANEDDQIAGWVDGELLGFDLNGVFSINSRFHNLNLVMKGKP